MIALPLPLFSVCILNIIYSIILILLYLGIVDTKTGRGKKGTWSLDFVMRSRQETRKYRVIRQ